MALSGQKYRELFKKRAQGELETMECTKSLFKILEPLYFDGMTILDVACGVGHYFRKLKELGNIKYTGVDIDPNSIEMAKDVWKDDANASFVQQKSQTLDFEDNQFDVVICYNLLLHLPGYKNTVKELFRVSKKLVIVRSLFDEEENLNTFEVNEDYKEIYPTGIIHYNTYARKEVEEFVKELGSCSVQFTGDNLAIPKEHLEKQKEVLDAEAEDFATQEKPEEKQEWQGLKLNYEVLFIKKE